MDFAPLRTATDALEAQCVVLESNLALAYATVADLEAITAEQATEIAALEEELFLLKTPPWPMFDGTIFEGFRARATIEVYPGESIQGAVNAAVNSATPGIVVAVHAGAYPEAIKFPSISGGTLDRPIVVFSVDGYRAATIRPPTGAYYGFQGLGVHDYAIIGFDIAGPRHGIHFARSGADETWDAETLNRNILVRWCYIRNVVTDGVKISQTDNAQVLDCDIENCGEEGIDCVNVWGIEAGYNRIRNARTAGLIVAKAGSKDLWAHHNWLTGQVSKSDHGIAFGGWADTPNSIRPGSPPHALTGGLAEHNRIEDIDGYLIRGASCKNVEIRGNYLVPNVKRDAAGTLLTAYHTMAMEPSVGSEGTASRMLCEDVEIYENHVMPGRNPLGLDGEQIKDRDRITYTAGTADLSQIAAGPRPF